MFQYFKVWNGRYQEAFQQMLNFFNQNEFGFAVPQNIGSKKN